MRKVAILVLGLGLVLAAEGAAAPALAADGAAVFNAQCKSCHSLTGKSGPSGPTLKGAAGRKVAGAADFPGYSPALKKKGGTWTDASLDAFLTNPAGFAPGGKMFVRVPQAENRAALIAYLKTQK